MKISIEPLNGENYAVWSQRMEMLLVHKKLWKGVTQPDVDADRTAEAKALIGLNVSSQYLGQIVVAKNAKEAWDGLEKVFRGKTTARQLQLKRELMTLKQESGEPVAKYVGRAKDLERELLAAGAEVKPQDLAMSVITGLSKDFDMLVTVLVAADAVKSVDEMLPQLQIHEQTERLKASSLDLDNKESAAAAAYVARKGDSVKSKKASMRCHKCGELGHFERECRKGSQGSQGSERPKNSRGCFTCGSPDHMKRDCPKKGKSKGGQGVAFAAGEGTKLGQWFLDSGASQHMTGDRSLFKTLEPLKDGEREIKFGNKGVLKAAGVGTVELRCLTPAGEQINTLREVMYVPGVAKNLFSVSRATELGAEFVFKRGVFQVFVGKEVVLRAELQDGLFAICQPALSWKETCLLVREAQSPELWHRRLGHAGYEKLARLAEEELVSGVQVSGKAFREKKALVYEACILGKQTREPFPKDNDSAESTEPLQLLHMDVCGPMPKASKGGSRYLATFLDDYSKLSVVQPLKKKSDVVAVTEGVLARLELQTGKKVKAVQTDRGGEYVNEDMTTLLRKRGTVHRKTAGYAPEQNGAAERLNRDLQEKGRAMLKDSGLGEEMWAEAMVTANYTRNRLPSSVHGRTPWEKFFGEKPDVSHMRVFGARAYMHIPKENRKKMQPVSERGVFLGYVFLMFGGAVSWSSRLQPTVAVSTVEAEYLSAGQAVKEALWFRKLGADLGLDLGPIQICCDNQGAIQLLKHPIASQRSKHIDVIHHFARERVARKEVNFIYCRTEDMKADILTKALAPGKFKKCRKDLGIQ